MAKVLFRSPIFDIKSKKEDLSFLHNGTIAQSKLFFKKNAKNWMLTMQIRINEYYQILQQMHALR